MDPSLSPPFHEIDPERFQELCRELFEVQETIATCEIYGPRGQKQYGVDLLAHPKTGSGIEVGQCKCYQSIHPSDIKQASDDFFDNFDHWKRKNVQRFILFVACDLDLTQQQDEILKQKRRFTRKGISYEVWSARTLKTKLSPHQAIVGRYTSGDYGEHWVKIICGNVLQPVSPVPAQQKRSELIVEALGTQNESLLSDLSNEKARRLDQFKELYREGKHKQAIDGVQSFLTDPLWPLLEKPLCARVLRVLASYILNENKDVSKAKELASDARELAPEADDTILRALIVYHSEGASEASRMISTTPNIDTFNLQIALLLELGHIDQVVDRVKNKPKDLIEDAETRRLHSHALLIKGDLPSAQVQIQKAIDERPDWQSIQVMFAMVDYFSALSPLVVPRYPVELPSPVDWSFVRRDKDSMGKLRRAGERFGGLATNTNFQSQQRRIFGIWQLACLANDPEKQVEAEAICQNMLQNNPADSAVLMWGMARGYKIDLTTSKAALERFIEESPEYVA